MTVPVSIAAGLPLLATLLSAFLADDGFKPGVNALIAALALLLTAIACVLLSASIPVTWPLRIIAVLAYVGILMNGDLSVLYQYLVVKPSPFVPRPAPANANPVRIPTPIVMPSLPPQGGAASIPVPSIPPAVSPVQGEAKPGA